MGSKEHSARLGQMGRRPNCLAAAEVQTCKRYRCTAGRWASTSKLKSSRHDGPCRRAKVSRFPALGTFLSDQSTQDHLVRAGGSQACSRSFCSALPRCSVPACWPRKRSGLQQRAPDRDWKQPRPQAARRRRCRRQSVGVASVALTLQTAHASAPPFQGLVNIILNRIKPAAPMSAA